MTCYIVGTGGQARVIADILNASGEREPVMVQEAALKERYDAGSDDVVIVGIGDNYARSRVVEAIRQQIPNCRFGKAVHPAAVIARDVVVGAGSVVMAGAIVNPGAVIGEHVILNTNCSVDHDCIIGDFVSIAPRVALGGTVKVGSVTAIGIGALVSHACEIGEQTVIGAGAVVVKSMPSYSVCYGVPARVVRSRQAGDGYL